MTKELGLGGMIMEVELKEVGRKGVD